MNPSEPELESDLSSDSLTKDPSPRDNPFVKRFKDWYLKNPKNAKINIAIIGLSALISIVLVLASFSRNTIFPWLPKSSGLADDEVWERLALSQRDPPFFGLTTKEERKFGILPKETFVLKTQSAVDENFVSEYLESSVPVSVLTKSDTEFEITPQNALPTDKVISFTVPVKDKEVGGHSFDRDYAWAFQSQPKFVVKNLLPANKATSVPVDTGIEIVFNLDNYEDPTKYISIEPKVDFRVERHGLTLAIIPQKPLSHKTTYTVTLKKGLRILSSTDTIGEDSSFTFQTVDEVSKVFRFSLSDTFLQVSPENEVLAKVRADQWNYDQKVKTEIYKFPTVESFIDSRNHVDEDNSWWTYYPEQHKVDTSRLAKFSESEIKLESKENVNYIKLPNKLTEGLYLVQFSYDDNKKLEQLWIQSTPLSGYVSVGKEQTVVWLNSLDGSSVSNASINLAKSSNTYQTDGNGVASFSTPQGFFDSPSKYLSISNTEGRKLILPVWSLSGYTKPGVVTKDDYWSYLYTERYLYRPEDTLYFWGIAKARHSNSAASNVEIKLISGYGLSKESTMIQSVVPASDGSFIGSVKLDKIPKGYYQLNANVGGVEIASTGIDVTEYTKPEMKIEVSSNKKAIFTGEEVEFTSRVSFFDGTPASFIPLSVSDNNSAEREISADKNGEVLYKYTPKYTENNSYYPRYEGVNVLLKQADVTGVYGYGKVQVYGSRLAIETEKKQEGDKAKVKATVYNLNLDSFNEGKTSEIKSGVAKGQKVTIKSSKTWYEKIEAGTYYDFVEKITRPRYDYKMHTEDLESRDLNTNNDGQIDYELTLAKDASYKIEITTSDKDGHPASRTEYFYYYQDEFRSEGPSRPELSLEKEVNTFNVGDNVNLKVTKDNKDYSDNDKNKFLFITANRGRQTPSLHETPSFSFTFNDEHKPNIYVGAIVFTGQFYEEVKVPCKNSWYCDYYDFYSDNDRYNFDGLSILYDKKESELSLDIKSDKEKYGPGEEAKITVKATKNGNPVSGSTISLTLVDEALAAIGGVKLPSIETTVYKSLESSVYYAYYTHLPLSPDPSMAEKGGGGGDRSEFGDTAYFGSATTDGEGNAVFTFKLLDNITNWLIYAQGVNENLDVGQEKSSLIATKEFFVTNQFPFVVIEGDKANLSINTYGKALDKNKKVNFEYAFFYEDKSEISKKEFTDDPFGDIYIPFPHLATGDYTVRSRGTYNQYSDGLTLPLSVIPTRLEFETQKDVTLEKDAVLESLPIDDYRLDKPIKLVISDQGKGKYYHSLIDYCYSYSNRIEKKIAKLKAGEILKDRFDERDCSIVKNDLAGFQDDSGGVKQVNWGSSFVETTAWAVYADSSLFDKEKAKKYFNTVVNNPYNKNTEKAYALWGLSSLGEPRINEINSLYERSSSYKEKVIIAFALNESGETEKVREIYYDLLADFAYTNKPYIRIQSSGKDMDMYLLDSAYALLLGSIVDKSYNSGLNLYLRDYKTLAEDIVLDLADISFIDEEISKLPDEDTSVRFVTKNRNEVIDLKKGKGKVIVFEGDEVNDFRLNVLSGKALVSSKAYIKGESFDSLKTDNRLKLSRNYSEVRGGDGNSINIGEIIEVKLDYDFGEAPIGCYYITDHIPSGFTYINNPEMFNISTSNKIVIPEVSPNVVTTCVYNSPRFLTNQYPVVYYARASAVGEYVFEPAFIQQKEDKSIFQKIDRDVIKIEQRKD
jgi:alpha-2-macroglobulin